MTRALLLLAAFTALAGCVERKMIIRSEPDGAEVWINRSEEPVGTTTHEQEFDQHGTFAVRLEKEGYLPLETAAPVPTPWYSYPVLDFITEVLWPGTIHDHHEFDFTLRKRDAPKDWAEAEDEVKRDREAVMKRAEELRRETLDDDAVGGKKQ
ncbi:MAG: PEGA domain-containing protein [Planctomycetota bacterium]